MVLENLCGPDLTGWFNTWAVASPEAQVTATVWTMELHPGC